MYLGEMLRRTNAMIAEQAAANDAEYVDTYEDSVGHDVCTLPGTRWFEGVVPTAPAFPVHPDALGEASMARSVLRVLGRRRPAPALGVLRRSRRMVATGRSLRVSYTLSRATTVTFALAALARPRAACAHAAGHALVTPGAEQLATSTGPSVEHRRRDAHPGRPRLGAGSRRFLTPAAVEQEENDMEETPLEVTQKYVDHLNWPASKDEVLESVQSNGAPDDVVELIRAMDKDTFTGINDVHNSLWMDT